MTTNVQQTVPSNPSNAVRVAAGFGVWLAAAIIAAGAELITPERGFLVPVAIFGSLAMLIVAYRRSASLRDVARAIDIRFILLYQGLRAPIGAVFLWLMGRGLLAPEFALLAGWGDIVAGGGALALILAAPFDTVPRRRLLRAWNWLGLVDISLVVLSAQRIFLISGEPEKLRGLLEFPGPMLPLIVVPLVFATHLLVFARLRSNAEA